MLVAGVSVPVGATGECSGLRVDQSLTARIKLPDIFDLEAVAIDIRQDVSPFRKDADMSLSVYDLECRIPPVGRDVPEETPRPVETANQGISTILQRIFSRTVRFRPP